MTEANLRHSIATREDIENISDKWKFHEDSVILTDIKGYHEARLQDILPPKLRDLLHNFNTLRIVFRDDRSTGDLFFVDAFPGITLELERKKEAKAASSDFEVYKYLDLLTGIDLGTREESNAFIDVGNRKIFYSKNATSQYLSAHIQKSFEAISSYIEDSRCIEFMIESESGLYSLRTVSAMPTTLFLRKPESGLKVEVGIMQRQKRHLEDSEYKGLSTYLPAIDFDPFMIFFDQRLRPLVDSPKIVTRIRGQGSHLSFDTDMSNVASLEPAHHLRRHCKLISMYYLPRTHFFDLFELEGLFGRTRVQLLGEQDLEAPVWDAKSWGSILSVEVESPDPKHHLQIPFHARYLQPSRGGEVVETQISAPQLFTACSQEDAAFIDNPWESATLKELIIGDNYQLRFYQNDGPSSFVVRSAVADSESAQFVMWSTLLCLGLGFVFVLRRVFQGLRQDLGTHGSKETNVFVQESVDS